MKRIRINPNQPASPSGRFHAAQSGKHSVRCVALAALLLSGVGASVAQGQTFTYLDATDDVGGNTTLSDGSTLVANDTTGSTTWRQRDNAAFGSQGTVFEGVQPSPEIKTTITGLFPGGEYILYVNFWDPQSTAEDWNVRAGFTSGNLTLFSREGESELAGSTPSVLASTLNYSTPPTLFGPSSGRENMAGLLGTAFADGSGNLAVFIDDFGSTDVNLRAWYDGVSYALVPEPSTFLLGGVGLAALLIFRRRN